MDEEMMLLIRESKREVPIVYHDMLRLCHEMGGDIKGLLSNPTFDWSDIGKYYYELKRDRNM